MGRGGAQRRGFRFARPRPNFRFVPALAAGLTLLGPLPLGAQTQGSHLVTVTFPEVAALTVSGGNITVALLDPLVPGGPVRDGVNDSCYLLYSCTAPAGQHRRITAEMTGSAPTGCSLRLTAVPRSSPAEGVTKGELGLTSTPTDVIELIPGCSTGTSPGDGARLTYTLRVLAPTSLVPQSTSATVRFTLTGT